MAQDTVQIVTVLPRDVRDKAAAKAAALGYRNLPEWVRAQVAEQLIRDQESAQT